MAWQYAVVKFVVKGDDPTDLQGTLNEWAGKGAELVSTVEAASRVLWLIFRRPSA